MMRHRGIWEAEGRDAVVLAGRAGCNELHKCIAVGDRESHTHI